MVNIIMELQYMIKKKYMEDYNHRFFERLDDKNVNWFLGTKNPNEYCCNCSLDNEYLVHS